MTSTPQSSSPESRETIARFLRLSVGFWSGASAARAWWLTLLVLGCMSAQIATQIGVNAWNRLFFDALERKDVPGLITAIGWLPLLVIAAALAVSVLVVSRMWLQVRWREWLTDKIAGWWIADQRYYRLAFVAPDQSAPEFRIAEDVRLAVEPLVDFAAGFVGAVITALAFAGILWQVAGSLELRFGENTIVIPAYLAVAALLYAALTSTVIYVAGRPLVARISAKNEAEARFRAELSRLRENAESIALERGDADELAAARMSFARVVQSWLSVVRQQGVIALVLNSNSAFLPVLPLLLVTPKYLSGELSLGAVMQALAAFLAVQGALMWFVDNFVRLAEWYASAERVLELTSSLVELDLGTLMEKETRISMGESDDGAVHLDDLSIAERSGRIAIKDASVRIEVGEKVLVTGENDAAESMLVRALAGLWPWGSGVIRLPPDATVAFVPQSPYLPLGNLRDLLLYPTNGGDIADAIVLKAMARCGLAHLSGRLDEASERWDRIMSLSERQRVAFCRLLIHKPEIIVMDDATSALDRESQSSLLSMFQHELKGGTVISVGHSSGLGAFLERKIILEKRLAVAPTAPSFLPPALSWLLRSN
ncbi:MAG: ABC transporter ATP-binding protein/permease [Beijerinckiaceae bacterium]